MLTFEQIDTAVSLLVEARARGHEQAAWGHREKLAAELLADGGEDLEATLELIVHAAVAKGRRLERAERRRYDVDGTAVEVDPAPVDGAPALGTHPNTEGGR